MRLIIFTIVLDGEPFIERHLPVFEQLSIPWEWRIAEGRAANTHCTKWCSSQNPRLSRDGTSEYLNQISSHPNVRVFRRQLWDGKVSMCNACLRGIEEECALLQADVDEFFTAEQMERMVNLLNERPSVMRALFWCRYWLGRNIVSTSRGGFGNRAIGEWLRLFRYRPGQIFSRHEPPVLGGNQGLTLSRDETKSLGLVFDHFAYALESTVEEKQSYYQYQDAVKHWKRLQENTKWPVLNLQSFLPWVGPNASADLFENLYPEENNPVDQFLK